MTMKEWSYFSTSFWLFPEMVKHAGVGNFWFFWLKLPKTGILLGLGHSLKNSNSRIYAQHKTLKQKQKKLKISFAQRWARTIKIQCIFCIVIHWTDWTNLHKLVLDFLYEKIWISTNPWCGNAKIYYPIHNTSCIRNTLDKNRFIEGRCGLSLRVNGTVIHIT